MGHKTSKHHDMMEYISLKQRSKSELPTTCKHHCIMTERLLEVDFIHGYDDEFRFNAVSTNEGHLRWNGILICFFLFPFTLISLCGIAYILWFTIKTSAMWENIPSDMLA